MPKKRFSDEQIAFALRQAKSGTAIAEIRRLKQLEDENSKLKRLVADLTLDKTILQDALKKSGKASPSPRGYQVLSRCFCSV